jgi:hypothetical protein
MTCLTGRNPIYLAAVIQSDMKRIIGPSPQVHGRIMRSRPVVQPGGHRAETTSMSMLRIRLKHCAQVLVNGHSWRVVLCAEPADAR